MKNFVKVSLLAVVAWTFAGPASASTLTLVDSFNGSTTTWTLNIGNPCQTDCPVTLSANFADPDGAGAGVNTYTGKYIDAVHWVIGNPNVSVTDAGFNATNAGTVPQWTFTLDASPNANQCGANGPPGGVCGAWVNGAVAPGGFGPIVNGSTLTWGFLADFSAALPATLVSGNIRGAFNNLDGSNFNIFSPGGGSFTTSTPSTPSSTTNTPTNTTNTTGATPEPGLLTLLGTGLVMAGRRMRRQKA